MHQNIDILPKTEGYYKWLEALKPGHEVLYRQNGNYWNRNNKIQTVIEHSKDRIILNSGEQINPKTGRLIYCRTSYSDREIHIRPVTESDRQRILFNETQSKFHDAVSTSKHQFTVNEMLQIMKFINKLLLKRVSHIPVVEGK